MEDNQKVLSNEERIDLSVQRLIEENREFAKEHLSEQVRLLVLYRMDNLLPVLAPFASSAMKTDLARITLLLTGNTAIAEQFLLKRDRFKLKEFSSTLIECAFRKAFPDAGLLLERAGQIQAEAERFEMQNAFLEKMLQLKETNGKLKSALAGANAQNEIIELKEKNQKLEAALREKDAELSEAVRKSQITEANFLSLADKIRAISQDKEGSDIKSEIRVLLNSIDNNTAFLKEADQKNVERQDCLFKEIGHLSERLSAVEERIAGLGNEDSGNAAILEKLEALDWIAAIVEDTNEHKDSQQIRDDLQEIRDLIQESIAQQKRSKGFLGRRRKLRKAESAEPDPELEPLVVGILKNSEYTEGQLAIIQAAVEQGMRQGLSAADLSELADPKIPEDNMTKLARFLFLRRKLVFHAPDDANGGTAQEVRKEKDTTEAKAGSLEEDYIV